MANDYLNKVIKKAYGYTIDYSIVLKVKRKGSCVGIILSFLIVDDDGNNCVCVGHSLCSSEDQFKRELAYTIAINRAISKFKNENYFYPHSIRPEFEKMCERMSRYYKGDNVIFPKWYVKP